MKKLVVLGVCLFVLNTHSVYAQQDECLHQRRLLIGDFKGEKSTSVWADKTNGHIHDYNEVLESDSFKDLCEADQSKLKRIIHSTVRIFVLDENDKVFKDDNVQITGTYLIGGKLLAVIRQESSKARWKRDPQQEAATLAKSKKETLKPFRLKLVNAVGEEAIVNVIRAQFYKPFSSMSSAVMYWTDFSSAKYPKFSKHAQFGLWAHDLEINSEKLFKQKESKQQNQEVFHLGYEIDTWGTDYYRVSFGADSCFYDFWDANRTGELVTGTTHIIETKNLGSGVYDANFNMIGLDYGSSAYPLMNKFTQIFRPLPSDLFQESKKQINE
jgi:hypothetical protein